MKIPYVPVLVLAVVTIPALAPAAESVSVLLQKAIYAEETEGNLESAIKLYEQISSDAASNRPLVAQAQYRLAVCYQKQGRKEQAIRLLNELVKQNATDATLNQQLRARLAELGQSPAESVVLKKIPLSTGGMGTVSKDGRFLTSWRKNAPYDVIVTELATGKEWTIAKPDGENDVVSPVLSPDSATIAYLQANEVYLVANREGAERRKINRGKIQGQSFAVAGWAPDGARLLLLSVDEKTRTGAVSSLDLKTGESKELIRRPVPQQIGPMRLSLSNSGRYLVGRAIPQGSKQRKLIIYDLAAGTEGILVDREVTDFAGWSPEDDKVLFFSARTGATGLWAVAVRDGKAVGEPELVKPNTGEIQVVGVTREGGIYYIETIATDSVYVAAVDFQTGEVSGQPRRVTERFPGLQSHPVWSNDGKRLMIAIQREHKRFIATSLADGEETEYTASVLSSFGDYPLQKTAWSQEGGFLLVQSVLSSAEKSGIHRYDLATGRTESLVLSDDGRNWNCQPKLSPDGKSFYYARREFSPPDADQNYNWKDSIVRRDLGTGKEEVAYALTEKLQIWSPFDLSRDGTRLAVVTSTRTYRSEDEAYVVGLKIVDLGSGTSRELIQFPPRMTATSIAWTPDGKRLVYALVNGSANNGPGEIWAIDVASRQTVQLRLPMPRASGAVVSPDGRQIAFLSGSGTSSELWAMEGLLPKLVAQK